MTFTRPARMAALIAFVAWVLKGIAIAAAGGLDKSPVEGPLFLIGMLAAVVAMALIGLTLVADRSLVIKIVTAVVAVAAGVVLSVLLQEAAHAVLPESMGWVPYEMGLWITGALLVLIAFVFLPRTRSVERV